MIGFVETQYFVNEICTSDHMFTSGIWDKFIKFAFYLFWNLPNKTREILKFQKMNEATLSQISQY